MDTKNEDSAGSDSLDKSLQKKCVMEDVGQCESLPLDNSIKAQKTGANSIRNDGGGDEEECGPDTAVKIKAQQQQQQQNTNAAEVDAEAPNCSESNNTNKQNICNSSNNNNSNNNTNNNTAFESKVKQISKNLKETTLAECSANKKTSLEDASTTSTSSCSASNSSASSSSSSSPNFELPSTSRAAISRLASDSVKSTEPTAAPSILPPNTELAAEASELLGEHDDEQRSKKVRFHPNVKEADGCPRGIPKKKKKFKASTDSDDETDSTGSQNVTLSEDEMELDGDEMEDENEVFSFDKTMADAVEYLEEHPLTFVRIFDNNSSEERLPNGLLEANHDPDVNVASDVKDEEDVYLHSEPQNGVERILGRQTVCEKTSYLLRYVGRTGVFWEAEEFVSANCPNLLNLYEENLQKRQQRLRRYVDKRLNFRQRYTDF